MRSTLRQGDEKSILQMNSFLASTLKKKKKNPKKKKNKIHKNVNEEFRDIFCLN